MISTGNIEPIKSLRAIVPPHWSGVEASNVSYILTSQKIFFNSFHTFNWSTPVWSLSTLKDTFYKLNDILETKQLFESYLLWWDIGFNGIHIHCMGKGDYDITRIRKALSKIWNSLSYRKTNVYSRLYKTPNPYIQSSYFRKHIATHYRKSNVPRDEALLRGWEKIGHKINFQRFILVNNRNNYPLRLNIFSPYSYISNEQIKIIDNWKTPIKGIISIVIKNSKKIKDIFLKWALVVESFTYTGKSCGFNIIKNNFTNETKIEIYFPNKLELKVIEYAKALLQKNNNIAREASIKVYNVNAITSSLFLLYRVHGQIVYARGDCSINLRAPSKRPPLKRPRSYQETKLRKLYGGSRRSVSGPIWLKRINSRSGSAFSLIVKDLIWKEVKPFGRILKSLFEEENIWACFTIKKISLHHWALSGICNKGAVLKNSIYPNLISQANFSLSIRVLKDMDLAAQAFIGSLPSHPVFNESSILYTTKE
jgi:hypothetical protein